MTLATLDDRLDLLRELSAIEDDLIDFERRLGADAESAALRVRLHAVRRHVLGQLQPVPDGDGGRVH